jgi:hypothetical protein
MQSFAEESQSSHWHILSAKLCVSIVLFKHRTYELILSADARTPRGGW